MSTLFVTGSGTGVGKTLVTAALASSGPATALKPVSSGFDPLDLEASDPGVLLRAQGKPVSLDAVAAISPWRFRAPLSPDMAAQDEGRAIDLEALVAFCRAPRDGLVLIEGVGGVMVPLGGGRTVLDWIVEVGAPVVMVTGSYLGTLSHTLTALAVLDTCRVPIHGVVVSASPDQPVPLARTAATLRGLTVVPVLELPRLDGPEPWREAATVLRELRP